MITAGSQRQTLTLNIRRGASAWFHTAATVTLIAILAALLLHWPVPSTGLSIDVQTGTVLAIEPGSMADLGGVTVGDQIVRIYNYDWAESERQFWLFPLDWRTSHPVPIQLVRGQTTLHVVLTAQTPSWDAQIERVTWFVLALAFWLTGYLFGILQGPNTGQVPAIAWYWIGIGTITGIQNIVRYGSYPLSVVLWYILITICAPMSVYINVWFAQRSTAPNLVRRVRRWVRDLMIAIQCLALALLVAWRPSIAELRDLLSLLVLPASACGFLIVSIFLWRAYHQTTILHVRRQIRLLGSATLLVAAAWLCLRSIPLMVGMEPLVGGYWIVLLSSLIPGAYLVGDFVPDLYPIDRVLSWLLRHMSISVVLLAILGGIIMRVDGGPIGTLWLAVVFVVAYRPLSWSLGRLVRRGRQHPSGHQPLIEATRLMTATLDRDRLVDVLVAGIHQTFGSPPLAIYVRDESDLDQLMLVASKRLRVPAVIAHMDGLAICPRERPIVDHEMLRDHLPMLPHTNQIEELLTLPGIALWAPLWQGDNQLLGIILLGFRDDLDPYRRRDLEELQRFFDAATLAFANSAAFVERQRDATTIHELYQRLQHAQDQTAATIAREIHDEVINVGVRTNLITMRRLLERSSEPDIVEAITDVIDGELAMSVVLRNICERLHPNGIDDPLGLPAVLQRQVERSQAIWDGEIKLLVVGKPMPLAPAVQREALRITREAITNAIKHAHGSEITVTLTYPVTHGSTLCLVIRDDGILQAVVRSQPGHFGIHNMLESARIANGQLSIETTECGTSVMFQLNAHVQYQ